MGCINYAIIHRECGMCHSLQDRDALTGHTVALREVLTASGHKRHYLEYSKWDHVSSRAHSHVLTPSSQFILSHWRYEAHDTGRI